MFRSYSSRRNSPRSNNRLFDHALNLHRRLIGNEPMRYKVRDPDRVNVTNGNVRHVTYSAESDEDEYNPGTYTLEKNAKVTAVDLLSSENGPTHHTDKYDKLEEGGLVVRRGQPFRILVRFDRKFDPKKNSLRFVFKTGNDPKPGKGTHIQTLLSSIGNLNGWSASVESRPRKSEAIIVIYTPPDCIVSDWKLTIENIVPQVDKPRAYKYTHPDPIFILFNPWCKDDAVYFKETDLLNEYILNDSGVIFNGNYKQIGAKPWFYGQFEDNVLDAALFCIQRGFNSQYGHAMADPVRVSRIISKIVNSNDDNGVIVGNWSEDYSGGKSPVTWNGSVAILKEYLSTKKPVKFGQCFVFAGLVTTICRALGLPCRTVTNYASAHDSDGSITIDFYWDSGKREVQPNISDSIWNFHCWNDVWMKRGDLPDGYGGWQIVDSTPQERSDGMFQCGPTSLKAVKEGKCEMLYDAPFVFAEVNADKINWARSTDGQWYIVNMDISAIGKKISTKVPDGKPVKPYLTRTDKIREDITNDYKYTEESQRERLTVISASRSSSNKKPIYDTGFQRDVKFGGFAERDFILIGGDFEIRSTFRNTSRQPRTLEGKTVCEAVSYTGERQRIIKQESIRMQLNPNTDGDISMTVFAKDYLSRISEYGAMKVSMMVKVLETGQIETWQDDFRLRVPDMLVEVMTSDIVNKRPFQCQLSFKNPLPTTQLTTCKITVEGPGLDNEHDFRLNDIAAGREWVAVLTLTPRKAGRRQISVSFSSDQIKDINGVADVTVRN